MSAMSDEAVREALKLPSSVEVHEVIERAESHIAEELGPLSQVEVVERVRGRECLVLSTPPVLEILSVTGTLGVGTVALDSLLLDDGLVRRADELPFTPATYTVTYLAGFARVGDELPGGLQTAVIEMVRHLRRGEVGGSRRAGTQTDDDRPPGFLFPYAVLAAMKPYRRERVDGFA